MSEHKKLAAGSVTYGSLPVGKITSEAITLDQPVSSVRITVDTIKRDEIREDDDE